MDYKDILHLPYNPVCDCFVAEKWVKMPFEERIKFLQEHEYHDVFYMYCRTIAGDMFEKEKEFTHMMSYIQDIAYITCVYDPQIDTNSGRKFMGAAFPKFMGPRFEQYEPTLEHVGREYTTIPEMVLNTIEESRRMRSVDRHIPQTAFNIFWDAINCSDDFDAQDFSRDLGFTRHRLASTVFPWNTGVTFRGRTPIFKERLEPKFLIIIGEEVEDQFNDIREAVLVHYYNSLEKVLNATLAYHALQGHSTANLLMKCDVNNFDWRKWYHVRNVPPLVYSDPKQEEEFKAFIAPVSALEEWPDTENDVMQKLYTASFVDKAYMYENEPISWRSFYNGDIGEHTTDVFSTDPLTVDITINDDFRLNAWKQYPYIICGNYLTTEYVVSEVRYKHMHKADFKRANDNYAVQYWLYGEPGIRTLTDLIGGEKVWPDVYSRPEAFKSIPVRPAPLTLANWTPQYKTIYDIDAFKWDNSYWPFIESYCKWSAYMGRMAMEAQLAKMEAKAREEEASQR